MRVTTSMLYRTSLSDLNSIAEANKRLLERSGTGRRLNKPSDDPVAAVRQLRLRKDISMGEELVKRLHSASDQLRGNELALDSAGQVFTRAKDLALSAANGARSEADFAAIAKETDELLKELVAVGNRKVNDRYLFAGTATTTQPFVTVGAPVSAVVYQGNGDTRQVAPAPGVSIDLNLPGSRVFQGSVDAFQALIDLRDAVLNRDVDALASTVLTGIDEAMDQFSSLRTEVGSTMSTVARTVESLNANMLSHEEVLASLTDADLVETMVELTQVENRRTAALQTIARVAQPTLFDLMA